MKTYYGHIDLNALESSHTQMFLFIKEHCDNNAVANPKVLEIGCSGGYFSEALRDHGMYVYAVEPFSDEAKTNNRVDDFFYGTVEDFCHSSEEKIYNSFDVIVLGDVLEHLLHPEKVIEDLGFFLKDNGVFVVSVPNITHVGVQHMLRDGQWIYQKYGILDSTHCRFFSWRSLREMFIGLGYGVERSHNIFVPEENIYPQGEEVYHGKKAGVISKITKKMTKRMKKKKGIFHLLAKWKILPLDAQNASDHIFQFIVRASKNALEGDAYTKKLPTNILIVTIDPHSSLIKVRLINPLTAYIAKHGGAIKVITCQEYTNPDILWADVLIVNREISLQTRWIVREAHKRGLAVIYDTDDLLTQIPSYSKHQIPQKIRILMEHTIATATRVTCSNQYLREELQKYADDVRIVPNIIPLTKKLVAPQAKHYDKACSLVIASSDSVTVDFLVPAINRLYHENSALNIVVIGEIFDNFKDVSFRISQYNHCSPEEFSDILNGISNGIGLIPLEGSFFSSCKSPIKYFHYTSCGIVTIASAVKPYADCIQNETNGILINNTADEWYDAVTRLINDPLFRQNLIKNAQNTWKETGSDSIAVAAWENVFYGMPKPFPDSSR